MASRLFISLAGAWQLPMSGHSVQPQSRLFPALCPGESDRIGPGRDPRSSFGPNQAALLTQCALLHPAHLSERLHSFVDAVAIWAISLSFSSVGVAVAWSSGFEWLRGMEKDFKEDPDVLAMNIDLGLSQGAVLC